MFLRLFRLVLTFLSFFLWYFAYVLPLLSAPGASSRYRIAVAPVHTKSARLRKSARAIHKIILDRFVEQRGWSVVERDQLRGLQQELALQQSGALDPKKASRLGKMLSANKLLLPELLDIGGQYLLHLRLLDVEKAQVEFTTKVRLSNPLDLKATAPPTIAACDELIRKMKNRDGQAYYTALVPGWAQFRRGQFWWGLGFSSGAVLLAGAYFQSRSNYLTARSRLEDPIVPAFLAVSTRQNAPLANYFYLEGLKRDVSNRAQQTNALAGWLGVLWIANYLHALWFVPGDSLFSSGEGSVPGHRWHLAIVPSLVSQRPQAQMHFFYRLSF